MKTFAIILAAGKGTRMKSDLPKVMHKVGGIPMIEHLVNTLKKIGVDETIVVVGHQAEVIKTYFQERGEFLHFVEQKEQLGTGHAVQQVNDILKGKKGKTLILTGDTPLLSEKTLKRLLDAHLHYSEYRYTMDGVILAAEMDNPTGYGRIIQDPLREGKAKIIVEEKDATSKQKKIKLVNTGIFCVDNELLFDTIFQLKNENVQKEYYLTDIARLLHTDYRGLSVLTTSDSKETMGINDRIALAEAEKYLQKRINECHMENGVTMIDPASIFIDSSVTIEKNVTLHSHVSLKGSTRIQEGSDIGMNCIIENSHIGKGTKVIQSVILDSHIGQGNSIGPFAYVPAHSVTGEFQAIDAFDKWENH